MTDKKDDVVFETFDHLPVNPRPMTPEKAAKLADAQERIRAGGDGFISHDEALERLWALEIEEAEAKAGHHLRPMSPERIAQLTEGLPTSSDTTEERTKALEATYKRIEDGERFQSSEEHEAGVRARPMTPEEIAEFTKGMPTIELTPEELAASERTRARMLAGHRFLTTEQRNERLRKKGLR